MEYLGSTRQMPWDEFWAQGGRITPKQRRAEGVYEISQLTIGGEARLLIGVQAHDTGWDDEVFFIAPGRDERFGVLEHEARYRPRRARITEFPDDLDVAPFVEPPRQYALVTIHRDATVQGAYETVAVDAGLLVTAKAGARLLFYADQDVPLDMYVVADPGHIDGYLRAAASIVQVP